MTTGEYGAGRGMWGWLGDVDWGAILASVISGMGVTVLLLTLGAAVGIEAADDDGGDNAGRIAAGVGTWAVISAILGTLVGTFIGGRFSRTPSPGAATYHGLTSWALATLLSVWLGATGALGLLGSALSREGAGGGTGAAGGGEQAADAISWGGWALALGMLLTLITAIVGWHLGARSRLTRAEMETGGRMMGGPGGSPPPPPPRQGP